MERLSNGKLLMYAAPWVAVMAVNLAVTSFVPGYYSSDLGLPLFSVSLVLLASRAFDVVIDPFIGGYSDRTTSRFGRRKPWIVIGIPILVIGCWIVFAPPANPSIWYLLCGIIVTYLGFTTIQIVYCAWGAELSDDYVESNRIAGWREAAGVVGMLFAMTLPLTVGLFGNPGVGAAMFVLAIGVTILMPLLALPALVFVRDTIPVAAHNVHESLWTGARDILRNRDFVWFSVAVFITFVGISPGAAMGYLMMKHTFGAENLFPYLVLSEYLMMLLFLPFWIWCASKIGKHRAIAIGIMWMIAFSLPVPFLGLIDPNYVIVGAALRGIGFGAIFVVPYGLASDIIDIDTLKNGRSRAGLYMAVGGMILKTSFMFGAFLATAWPTLFGFEPSAAVNTKAAEFQVAVSYAWLTCFFLAIAAPMFWFYPMTRDRHAALKAALSA